MQGHILTFKLSMQVHRLSFKLSMQGHSLSFKLCMQVHSISFNYHLFYQPTLVFCLSLNVFTPESVGSRYSLSRISSLLTRYKSKDLRSLATHSATTISPPSPCFRGKYKRMVFALGCIVLYLSNTFPVFLSISSSSALFHPTIAAPLLQPRCWSAHISTFYCFLQFTIKYWIWFYYTEVLITIFVWVSYNLTYGKVDASTLFARLRQHISISQIPSRYLYNNNIQSVPYICVSLLANSFKSSINRTWLIPEEEGGGGMYTGVHRDGN